MTRPLISVTHRLKSATLWFVLVACMGLVGCGWVDSTGAQSRDLPVVTFEANTVVDLIENEPMLIDPTTRLDPDGEIQVWRWSDEPVSAGNLSVCLGTNGFNQQFVADTLEDACVAGSSCSVQFTEEVREVGGLPRSQFVLLPPVLRAPVGVSYELFGVDANGVETSNEFTFCLIAVNEAPDAVDDGFTVTENETLVVSSSGPNLLSNDTDDDDVSNLPLSVIVEPQDAPSFAAEFTLFADGGFRYRPQTGFTGTDDFTYLVSDGFATNDATVTLVVRASNQPPELLSDLPALEIIEGVPVDISLGDFFVDPEGANISFSATDLPEELSLSEAGDLSGTVSEGQTGDFSFDIEVTDGFGEILVPVSGDIEVNRPPVALDLPDLIVDAGDTVRLDTARFFSDPEQQPLLYTLRAPVGLTFSINRTTGVLSGVAADAGEIILTIAASDGFNDEVRAEQQLVVTAPVVVNRRPTYTGSLGNQTLEVGELITPVVPRFTDPDGDRLRFSLVGTRPAGLAFNVNTGRLTGRPTAPGIFRNLAIRATDPDGLFTTSDPFTLIVEPAPDDESDTDDETDAVSEDDEDDTDASSGTAPLANRAPVAVDIPNVVFDDDFTYNVSVFFDDPDDDELTFSAVNLPPRVTISLTGVISGTASAANDGNHLIVVTASDGRGGLVSDGFRLTIDN